MGMVIFNPADGPSLIQRIVQFISEKLTDMMIFAKEVADRIKEYMLLIQFVTVATLAGIIIGIFKNPLQFIVLVIGGLILSIIYVIYKISSYPPMVWIPFVIWFSFTILTYPILYTITLGFVVILICIVLGIIAIANNLSNGRLSNMVLCQTSPSAWYQLPNYHLANKFERSLFCKTPCITGYRIDEATGEYCNRIPRGQPSYCPQAEIMRIFSGYNKKDKQHVFSDYKPFFNFWFKMKTPELKENDYKNYYITKSKYDSTCKDKLSPYTQMTMDLCSSLDLLENDMKTNGLTPKDIKRLREVCSAGFCNSRNHFSFCGTFTQDNKEEKNKAGMLIKNIIIFVVLLSVFAFSLTFTYEHIKSGRLPQE